MKHFRLIMILFLSLPLPAQANESLPVAKSFKINYATQMWNEHSDKIDSAFLILKDPKSKQVIRINLEESAPDAAIFSGQFTLKWNSGELQNPDIYVPPMATRKNSIALTKFNQQIIKEQKPGKPYFVRKENGLNVIEVFDSTDELKRAQLHYLQLEKLNQSKNNTQLIQAKAKEDEVQLSQDVQQRQALHAMALAAAQNEQARLRTEMVSRQRLEQKRTQFKNLTQREQNKNKNASLALVRQAKELYVAGKFNESLPLFQKAHDLYPVDNETLFSMAVVMYRLDSIEDSLIQLRIVQEDSKITDEKNYYLGLIHYKKKELDLAQHRFQLVKKSANKLLAPSAAFYDGLIYFTKENLDEAQKSFEFVIDQSNDANLDKKAEEYLEQIIGLKQFNEFAAKKIFINLNVSQNYDSNVLLVSDIDTTTGDAADKGDFRNTFAGDVEYRIFYKKEHDYSTKLAANHTRSFDENFVRGDPLTVTLSTPYNRRGLYKTKGYKLALTPSYESLYLDFDSSGDLNNILQSISINTDLMLIMKENWFSSYTLDVRQDESKLPGTEGDIDEDADAMKYTFTKTEMFFTDAAKKTAVIASLGFTQNAADGDEKKYRKIDLKTIIAAPWERFKNVSWNAGITLYKQDYFESEESRKDTNTSFLIGVVKNLNDHWRWGLNGNYTNSISTQDTNTYSKYTIMGNLAYSWDQ